MHLRKYITGWILHYIARADTCTTETVLQAAVNHYRALYPEEEILFLSLPRNHPQERKRLLDAFQTLLKETDGKDLTGESI